MAIDQQSALRTKRDIIVNELRSLIATGAISRGDRIQQDDLAERFGTSITPVREALLQLEAEGVVTGEPHRGMRVAEVNPQRVKVNYIMRRLVECYAMKRATLRVSRLDLDVARKANADMRAAYTAGDRPAVSEANRRFHFAFYTKCGVPKLTSEIDALWQSFPWDILQVLHARVPESINEHEDIIAAVEAGDIDRVEAATAEHLAKSYHALMEHVTGSGGADPFDLHAE
jgi:DNA-binding GntR family transcriptional regulator